MFTTAPTVSAKTKTIVRSAALGWIGMAYFAVIIVVLHFLRPDLSPISQPTSEYAVGPFGFLMTTAFLSMSLASWALVLGLEQGLPRAARSRTGLGLMAVWAVGVLIAMLFPIDAEGAPQTLAGTIHAITGPLAFLSLTVGALLVSRRLKHDQAWRPVYRTALLLSVLMAVAFVGIPLAIATESGLAGLVQRVFLVTFLTWFGLTAARLRAAGVRAA